MTVFILQTFFILLLAYLLGALTGCFLRKFFPADHVTEPRPSVAGTIPQAVPSAGTGFGATVGAATVGAGAAVVHSNAAARDTVGHVKKHIPTVTPPTQHIPTPHTPAPAVSVPKQHIPTPTIAPKPVIPTPTIAPKPVIARSPTENSDFLTEKRDVVDSRKVDSKVVLSSAQLDDDLTKIKGLGSILALKLKRIGITSLRQVAGWTQADILQINQQLEFTGRIEREDWIGQAQRLLRGQEGVVDGTTAHVTNKQKQISFPSSESAANLASVSSLTRTVTGPPDDLKQIAGVGVVLEAQLNEMGYTHIEHIEHLSDYDIKKISEHLEFTGRIEREDWRGQARRILGR